ncbi:MAG: hypothetical protein GX958_08825 [Desulfitobacterium sp.]|nr:hypothetical protein [Desulfitobacterium sp.]
MKSLRARVANHTSAPLNAPGLGNLVEILLARRSEIHRKLPISQGFEWSFRRTSERRANQYPFTQNLYSHWMASKIPGVKKKSSFIMQLFLLNDKLLT